MWKPPAPSIACLLARHGLHDCRVRLVAELDCTVWRVASPAGPDLSLRIYAEERSDITPINDEITWLCDLADAGVHVPHPLADRAGHYVMPWQADTHAAPRHAVLLRWLPGRTLYKSLRPIHLRRIGELAARLHESAARLVASSRLTSRQQAHQPDLTAWANGARRLPADYPAGLQSRVQQAAMQLQSRMSTWPRDTTHWSFVHGDLHLWNIVSQGKAAGAIDFSDGGWGFLAQDLAGVLQFLKHPLTPADEHHRAAYPRLREALLEGYATTLSLPDSVHAQIEPLIASRMLNTLQWIVDDWPRTDHRAWGPGFLSSLGAALEGAFE